MTFRAMVFSGDTVGGVMDGNRGAGSGFDWVRIGVSLSVILLHSFHTFYGYRPWASLANEPNGSSLAGVLPMFFGLSGFLVAGSAFGNRNLKIFLSFSMQDCRSSGWPSSRRGFDVKSIIFLKKITPLRCSSAKIG